MEKHILKAVDFDIGIPLSYTFLRRFAQVSASQTAEVYNVATDSVTRYQ